MENMHLTAAGQGEHLLVVSDVVTIKASGQETSGAQVVVEVSVPPGGGPPMLHRHQPAETFYVLEGKFEVTTADASNRLSAVRIGPGDTCSIPAMVWHTYKNVGATPGRFIAVLSPAGMERFFREIGRPLDDPRNPPVPAGPPSDEQRREMMAIIARHMEILPPDAIVR